MLSACSPGTWAGSAGRSATRRSGPSARSSRLGRRRARTTAASIRPRRSGARPSTGRRAPGSSGARRFKTSFSGADPGSLLEFSPMVAVLQTEGLTKHFGAFKAVQDLNLEVQEGDLYGFLGPNGSGKTTTMRMILRLIRPTAAQVPLLGKDIRTDFIGIMKDEIG